MTESVRPSLPLAPSLPAAAAASSLDAKGKGKASITSLRASPLVPSSSASPSTKIHHPDLTTATSFASEPNLNDFGGRCTTPKPEVKQRRVSTSAVPTLAQSEAGYFKLQLPFRDEMGIRSQASTSSAGSGRFDYTALPLNRAASTSETPTRARRSKMRKLATESGDPEVGGDVKHRRKMWTKEETQHLVDGCNIHGVGNWKTILEDPRYEFQQRTHGDLRDRFRAHFPEAYRRHYPNAKTHISDRVRSAMSDSSLYDEKGARRRRPFSPEEDEALRKGFEKHGTSWATIMKDSAFQSRRSMDLRDRFRNAFPDLYAKAGYKTRKPLKKTQSESEADPPTSNSNLLPMTRTIPSSPVMRNSGLKTKRVASLSAAMRPVSLVDSIMPRDSPMVSDRGEEDSGGEEPTFRPSSAKIVAHTQSTLTNTISDTVTTASQPLETSSHDMADPHAGMGHVIYDSTQDSYNPSSSAASSGITDDSTNWAPPTASPSPSDYLYSVSPSPRIGKSAWGPQTWLSPNPRLDAQLGGPLGVWPTSPDHGIFDRYDLYAGISTAHDFASDAGGNHHHHSFLDPGGNSFPGFTHHPYAGDLISGSGVVPGQEFEFLSTTSGGSHFGLGQLSLMSTEEYGDPMDMSYDRSGTGDDEMAGLEELLVKEAIQDPPAHSGFAHIGVASAVPLDVNGGSISTPVISALTGPLPSLSPLLATTYNQSRKSRDDAESILPTSSRPGASLQPPHHSHSQHRSFSQPPVEHRQPVPRPFSSLATLANIGAYSFLDSIYPSYPTYPTHNEPLSTAALDLHYGFNNHTTSNNINPTSLHYPPTTSRSFAAYHPPRPSESSTAEKCMVDVPALLDNVTATSIAPIRRATHQRGQTLSISPRELLYDPQGAGGDKKRKRASWDGGVSN